MGETPRRSANQNKFSRGKSAAALGSVAVKGETTDRGGANKARRQKRGKEHPQCEHRDEVATTNIWSETSGKPVVLNVEKKGGQKKKRKEGGDRKGKGIRGGSLRPWGILGKKMYNGGGA